jgi:DNA-binding transcriptional LysR family regulator
VRIKYLKVFVDLAESGSFSETAFRHGISQPAVSQQISCLEEEFAAPLIERSRRRFRLTPAGEALLTTARQVLESIDSVRSRISELDHLLAGTLQIVTTAHLGVEVVPALGKALQHLNPGIVLEASYQITSRIYADVAGNVADFGLIYSPKPDDRFETIILMEEPFTFVASPQAILPGKKVKLTQLTFVGYNPDPATTHLISHTLHDLGQGITAALEFSHPDTVIKAVEATRGFACLPAATVRSALAQGTLVDMSAILPPVTRQLGAIFYKQRGDHPLLKAVREFFEKSAGEWIHPKADEPDSLRAEPALSAA